MTERPKVKRVGLGELVVDLSTLKRGVVYDLIAEAQEMTKAETIRAFEDWAIMNVGSREADELIGFIAAALDDAERRGREEEREACAKLVVMQFPYLFDGGRSAESVADAIRARATPEKQ